MDVVIVWVQAEERLVKCFMQSVCYLVIYEALMHHGEKKERDREHFLVDCKLLEAVGF